MTNPFKSALVALLTRTPLGRLPVRVRKGVAAGARWTLYPYSSYWRGTHEPAMQDMLVGLGGGDIRGWCCWDLGAHFGLYSVGLARRVGPTGQVAAFEPNPVSFSRLQLHRDRNNLPWLKLYAAAVSDHKHGAELFTYGDLGTTTTHLPYEGETRTEKIGALNIPTIRLDDLVATGELRSPNFAKIDVEGHGHHALAGMKATLESARPTLVIAFHSQQEIDGMMALLGPRNYSWRKIGQDSGSAEIHPEGDYLFTPRSRA